VLLTLLVLLISILHRSLGHSWGEDPKREEWIYSFQESIFEIDRLQHGRETDKLDQLGYVGSAVMEVWINQHCSINSDEEGQATKECHQCYMNAKNISQSYQCTEKYLPKEYRECWQSLIEEQSNQGNVTVMYNTAIDAARCYRDTWLNLQFRDCIKELEERYPEETKKSKEKDFVPDLKNTTYWVRWNKYCMDRKKADLKKQIYGKTLNKMFGKGQCGCTALALMTMIPMPFEQLTHEKNMHKDNLVNKFMKFLDPPKLMKLRSTYKRERQDEEDDDVSNDEC